MNKRKVNRALKALRALEQSAPVQVRRTRDWFPTLQKNLNELEAAMGKDADLDPVLCDSCGEPIAAEPVEPVATEPPAPVEPENEKGDPGKGDEVVICPSCDSHVPNAVHCESCGCALEEAADGE